jgi:hypothetical protein
MGIKNAGKDFPLEDNNKILEINSPQESVGGVYAVVYKNLSDRYAIVAMDWDGKPHLGIRWFWSSMGNPVSREYSTWFVVPTSLSRNMLSGLPLDHEFSRKVDDFLAGKIKGTELK